MTTELAPTYNVDIHMAGDIAVAALVVQKAAATVGMCVSITPQKYVYTGGCEDGFKITFINYPRFPSPPHDILHAADDLANLLLTELGQHSYTIVSPEQSKWYSRREAPMTPTPQDRRE